MKINSKHFFSFTLFLIVLLSIPHKGLSNTETTNGGTDANNGGTDANNGGTDATNGGTDANNGGTDATNGGTDTNNGGTDATNGGTDTNNSGTDATNGGTDANNGGTDANNGGTDANNGGTDATNGGTDGATNENTNGKNTKVPESTNPSKDDATKKPDNSEKPKGNRRLTLEKIFKMRRNSTARVLTVDGVELTELETAIKTITGNDTVLTTSTEGSDFFVNAEITQEFDGTKTVNEAANEVFTKLQAQQTNLASSAARSGFSFEVNANFTASVDSSSNSTGGTTASITTTTASAITINTFDKKSFLSTIFTIFYLYFMINFN